LPLNWVPVFVALQLRRDRRKMGFRLRVKLRRDRCFGLVKMGSFFVLGSSIFCCKSFSLKE
jgi:hypothetical protein